MDKFTFVGNGDVNAVESLYEQFLADPNNVDETWQQFFAGFDLLKLILTLKEKFPKMCLKSSR